MTMPIMMVYAWKSVHKTNGTDLANQYSMTSISGDEIVTNILDNVTTYSIHIH